MEVSTTSVYPEDKFPVVKETKENPPKVPHNAWGKDANVETICPSFSDVLSEELANKIHLTELHASENLNPESNIQDISVGAAGDDPCHNDYLLAQSLQAKFDEAYHSNLQSKEKKLNENSKGQMEAATSLLHAESTFPQVKETKENPLKVPHKAWGKDAKDETTRSSFSDLPSKELANTIQLEKLHAFENVNPESNVQDISVGAAGDDPCHNDYLLAQTLQTNFDKEYDFNLQSEEKKLNGNSKVSLSYVNYLKQSAHSDSDDSDEQYDSYNDHGMNCYALDSFEKRERQSPTVGKSGIVKHSNGSITTKHDLEICGRRNATKVMQFAPGFETGDGGGFDMVLSNRVFNKLKLHSQAENKRHQRFHDKKEKFAAEQSIDEDTLLIIHKLVNTDILKSVSGIISTGKEACILHGFGGIIDGRQVPSECALKVYKTRLNEFVCRDKYISDDYRFKDRFPKHKSKNVVNLWAEKEMHNLKRLHSAGIPCPEVVVLKKNVLVMSFIGSNCNCASKLKEIKLSDGKWNELYHEVINIMKIMYHKCQLVHADLSEYNILWHSDKVWIIDVGQAVEPTHPRGLQFLFRDCTNICRFFKKRGVLLHEPKELFMEITQKNFPGQGVELLSAIQSYEKNEEMIRFGASQTSEAFDYIFENISSMSKSQKQGT